MQHRYLGNSGLKVSEIIYGNWLTHASQVADEQAISTVKAALEGGVTTYDTADVYANQAAETVLGNALKGQRREGLEILTKVYWPVAAKGPNDTGLSRKHIMESINGSLKRLQTDYVDLYQAHRFDYETPLEETMQAFADLVRMGKVLYVGVSEWNAEQIRAGQALAKELGFKLISNQPQYSMLWRVIEEQVIPTSEELGLSQIVWSPMAQGVLTGKYLPGQPAPAGSRAADPDLSGIIEKCRASSRLQMSLESPWLSLQSPGCCRTRMSPQRLSVPQSRSRSPRTLRLPVLLSQRRSWRRSMRSLAMLLSATHRRPRAQRAVSASSPVL
jgi:aryl-alcohol dehydrogenase-like predicted oxidoreductase